VHVIEVPHLILEENPPSDSEKYHFQCKKRPAKISLNHALCWSRLGWPRRYGRLVGPEFLRIGTDCLQSRPTSIIVSRSALSLKLQSNLHSTHNTPKKHPLQRPCFTPFITLCFRKAPKSAHNTFLQSNKTATLLQRRRGPRPCG
jgi:hypothetical protein